MTNDKPASDGGAESRARPSALPHVDVSEQPVRLTVEEQWAGEHASAVKPKKRSLLSRFRSAITGLFVSKQYAEANPSTTVRERVD